MHKTNKGDKEGKESKDEEARNKNLGFNDFQLMLFGSEIE